MPKFYSEQFKADAVALVESGMSRRQVCADLGVSRSSLQKWVTDARLQAHGMSPSSDPEVAKEMSAALKRIRELEMENEVLRAAREAKEARERAAAADEKHAAHKRRIDWKTAAAAGLGSAAVIAALIYARRDNGGDKDE